MKCFPHTSLTLLLLTAVPMAVFGADSLPAEISARLEPKWVAAAKQIRMPGRIVYYHGAAKGKMAGDGKHWIGKIDGEILFLTPKYAMACLDMRLPPPIDEPLPAGFVLWLNAGDYASEKALTHTIVKALG